MNGLKDAKGEYANKSKFNKGPQNKGSRNSKKNENKNKKHCFAKVFPVSSVLT